MHSTDNEYLYFSCRPPPLTPPPSFPTCRPRSLTCLDVSMNAPLMLIGLSVMFLALHNTCTCMCVSVCVCVSASSLHSNYHRAARLYSRHCSCGGPGTADHCRHCLHRLTPLVSWLGGEVACEEGGGGVTGNDWVCPTFAAGSDEGRQSTPTSGPGWSACPR